MPNHSSTLRITVPLPSAVSAMVTTIATNADSSASRSDILVRDEAAGLAALRPHI